MKKVLLLSILSIIIASCDNSNDGSIERVYYENIELTSPEENPGAYVITEQGNKTAIRFAYIHPDEENIADDELTEFFWIEIPSGTTEFNISTGNDVPQSGIEFYYVRSCFCYFEPYTFLRNDISGQKVSPTQWRISFDILAESGGTEYELKDTGTYVLTTFEN